MTIATSICLSNITAIAALLTFAGVEHGAGSDPEFSRAHHFEPSWREPADCGPLALYALLRALGENVSLSDVRQRIEIDPVKGCSMEDLQDTARALGVELDVRYVNAVDLSELDPPFILHGETSIARQIGHFRLIVGYNPDRKSYTWFNTDLDEIMSNPEDVILRGYSGYVMLPRNHHQTWIDGVLGCLWVLLGLGVLFTWGRPLIWKRPRAPTAPR
jgi:hypothetical protein